MAYRAWIWVTGALLAGCGEHASTHGGAGTDEWSATESGVTSSATETETTTTTETSSSSSATCAPPDDEGCPESVCDPQPECVEVGATLDGMEIWEYGWDVEVINLVQDCVIDSVVEVAPTETTIHLSCVDYVGEMTEHSIGLSHSPPIALPLSEGDEVQYELHVDVPWWGNLQLTLREPDGDLLLALNQADDVPNPLAEEWYPEYVARADMFAPFELRTTLPACGPDCEENDGAFIQNPCPCRQRHRIYFATEKQTMWMLDDTERFFGPSDEWHVRVGTADSWPNCLSTDMPSAWYEAIIVRTF